MKRWQLQAGLVALAVVVVVSVNGVWRWWHNVPPYGPQVLAATATLRFVSYQEALAALRPVGAPVAENDDQLVLGQVSWRPPPDHQKDSTLWIAVLDKRTHLRAAIQAAMSPRQAEIGLGSHGYLRRAADHYPWLQGIAGHEVDGAWWEYGECVFVSVADATPVTFAAIFPAASRAPQPGPGRGIPTAPVALPDLLVALVNVGPDGQIYWAQRLLG